MLSTGVLVLNRSFLPVHITSVKRAFILLYQGIAKAVDKQYELFDFESWSELSASDHDDTIGLVGRAIRVPRVILLTEYDRLPRRRVRFSRHNIYLRDKNTCQYCNTLFSKMELNLDHVVPRAQGGRTTWENVVCSCINCNRKKGGRTPEEAHMRLARMPRRPEWSPLYGFQGRALAYEAWKPFLNVVDASYWNVELKD
ncbi:MAG TPA: HNH endonuclease [bacterium]|nr:HNH endonuclease [bacterium]